MEAIEQKKVRGFTIKIYRDDCAESPREWDNFGTMLCGHRRYTLGDKQIKSQDDLDKILKRKDVKHLPLFLYDHSGITMSTSPFSCPWDSGQIGIIYVTHADICKEFGIKHVSKKSISQAFKLMCQEVEVYDAYIRGLVYGFVVENEDGEEIDSCWGFICIDGKLDHVYEAAMDTLPNVTYKTVKEELVDALERAKNELMYYCDKNMPNIEVWNVGGSGYSTLQIVDKAINRASEE